jgi:hypothetical protein
MTKWIQALKIWNQKKGGAWCVPRKGSEEHRQVMELMGGTPASVKKAPVKQDIKFKVAPKKAPVKTFQKSQSKSVKKQAPVKAPKKQKGGEVIDPKVDIIKSLDSFWKEITGSGLTKKQVKNIQQKTQHGGNWWDIAKALNTLNNFMIQPPPTIDTETGKITIRSGFDMI